MRMYTEIRTLQGRKRHLVKQSICPKVTTIKSLQQKSPLLWRMTRLLIPLINCHCGDLCTTTKMRLNRKSQTDTWSGLEEVENVIPTNSSKEAFVFQDRLKKLVFYRPLRSIPQNDDDSLLNQFEGLKAIHYVGGHKGQDARVYEGEGNQENHDGIFRKWAPARWATRMRATLDFPLDNDGRLSVKKSGLYYIYAQVHAFNLLKFKRGLLV